VLAFYKKFAILKFYKQRLVREWAKIKNLQKGKENVEKRQRTSEFQRRA